MWFTGSKEGENEESYGGCSWGWRFRSTNRRGNYMLLYIWKCVLKLRVAQQMEIFLKAASIVPLWVLTL